MAGRVLNGIHVSNHPDRFIEDMLRVTRPTGAAVVLHQLMLPDDTMLGEPGGDADNHNWLPLRYGRDPSLHGGWPAMAAPDRLLIIRLWHGNDPFQFDPAERATYLVRRLERWTGHNYPEHNLLNDPFVAIQATNECNIEPASSLALPPTERYDRLAAWESTFWDAFDKAAPGRRCMSCGPNLAFGHDWLPNQPDSEYEHPGIHELCRRHIETGGLLGIHTYYHGHRPWERGGPGEDNAYWFWMRPFRPEGYRDSFEPSMPHDRGGVVARFPDAKFAVTEAGSWRHSDPDGTAETVSAFETFMRAAQETGQFVAFCPFIWDTSRSAHPQNIIAVNESLRQGLMAMPDFAAADLPVAQPDWLPPADPGEPTAPPTPPNRLEPIEDASVLHWPVGASHRDRSGITVPAGWYIAVRFDEEYPLSGRMAVHPGLDLNLVGGGDSDLGMPVHCVAPGVVVAAGSWDVWGNIVMVKHRRPDGSFVWSQYAHLGQILVQVGDQVGLGRQLGTIGKGDGDRYIAHLHFELRRREVPAEFWPGMDHDEVRRSYFDPERLLGEESEEAPEDLALLQDWANNAQIIQPNMHAALLREVRADGYFPLSDEADVGPYRAQLARALTGPDERIYYARIGEWDKVDWVARGPVTTDASESAVEAVRSMNRSWLSALRRKLPGGSAADSDAVAERAATTNGHGRHSVYGLSSNGNGHSPSGNGSGSGSGNGNRSGNGSGTSNGNDAPHGRGSGAVGST